MKTLAVPERAGGTLRGTPRRRAGRLAIAAVACWAGAAAATARAQAPEPITRRLPPPGESIPGADRTRLEARLAALRERFETVRDHPLAADAGIFLKAVEFALAFDEFYRLPADLGKADELLEEADRRLAGLAAGSTPWADGRGSLVRGYRSGIDGSPQPFGLEIPESLDLSRKVPLYVWLHGRGDQATDLHFIHQRMQKGSEFTGLLDDGIIVHPFGRHCVGYKSAGEIDVLDVVATVAERYPVDLRRVALMGFSMGGAGAWHLGAHYADRWAVVHAGAGFVDVARYQRLSPDRFPPPVEQALWGLYDVPKYAHNFLNLPVIAYSGENDRQKDAADFMEEALAAHGMTLTHLVGPGMEHRYHPETKREVAAFVRGATRWGRPEPPAPDSIHWQTRTLRYPGFAWLEITGLDRHWEDTRVDASFESDDVLTLETTNVARLAIHRALAPGTRVAIDGSELDVPAGATPPHHLARSDGSDGSETWGWAGAAAGGGPRKQHGLQGPIDDAFLEPFLVVAPTGSSSSTRVDAWVRFELDHLVSRWRALFRGEPRVRRDVDVTTEDARRFHLILFGTPESNLLVARTLAADPVIPWNPDGAIRVGTREFDAGSHVLLQIRPNPEAPGRYVVLNSGPTFREAHDRTNSLQNPKLGDYAVIGLDEPPGDERPGRVAATGFFDEWWRLRDEDTR